jgi:hypothetical protein
MTCLLAAIAGLASAAAGRIAAVATTLPTAGQLDVSDYEGGRATLADWGIDPIRYRMVWPE